MAAASLSLRRPPRAYERAPKGRAYERLTHVSAHRGRIHRVARSELVAQRLCVLPSEVDRYLLAVLEHLVDSRSSAAQQGVAQAAGHADVAVGGAVGPRRRLAGAASRVDAIARIAEGAAVALPRHGPDPGMVIGRLI